MNCYDCKSHLWLFDEDCCFSYCMEKGAKVTDKFASETHFCAVPTDKTYHDYHSGHA